MVVQIYYTVYKITNLINGKFYIGVHKTSNLEDGYMGSGLLIRRAIKKYGLENFSKEYIAIFDNELEMYNTEIEIVNSDLIDRGKVYNLNEGGNGNWAHVNKKLTIEERRKYGSWKNPEKRRKILESIPLEKRREIGKKMGDKFGGKNKLSKKEIDRRLEIIKNLDLAKYGWVKNVSEILNLTHTQVRRFIEKYYTKEFYRRK